MTNREWINSLTDEEFLQWLFDDNEFDYEKNEYYQPYPRLNNLKGMYTSSKGGLRIWLKEERKQ